MSDDGSTFASHTKGTIITTQTNGNVFTVTNAVLSITQTNGSSLLYSNGNMTVTGTNASGVVRAGNTLHISRPERRQAPTSSAATLAGTFSGNGSGLTNSMPFLGKSSSAFPPITNIPAVHRQ